MAFNIKNMKPNMRSKHKEGYYQVMNPNKYLGDLTKVIFRSSYEETFFRELDLDPAVICWVAEPPEFKIKYYHPIKKRWASYFPDAMCVKMHGDKKIKCLIEIKPKSKLKMPVKTKTTDSKKIASFNRRMAEFSVIDAKRKSAVDYCRMKGMIYVFITEDTVKAKKI